MKGNIVSGHLPSVATESSLQSAEVTLPFSAWPCSQALKDLSRGGYEEATSLMNSTERPTYLLGDTSTSAVLVFANICFSLLFSSAVWSRTHLWWLLGAFCSFKEEPGGFRPNL